MIDFNIFDLSSLNNIQFGMDKSSYILAKIFGSPIYSYLGAGNNISDGTILTGIIGTFNSLILCVALLVYGYTAFVGTVGSARDGRFLGKMDTHWTPVRLILGPTMIFPVHGFGLIQYLIMYFILVGVNIGDQLWRGSLTQMTVKPPTTAPAAVDNQVAKQLATIFVYRAIQNSIGHFSGGQPLTVDVSGGSINVFGQYKSKFQSAIKANCPVLSATTGDIALADATGNSNQTQSLCEDAVDALFNSTTLSAYFPVAPLPVNQVQGSRKYQNIYVQLGSAMAQLDAGGVFTGKYTFDPMRSLETSQQMQLASPDTQSLTSTTGNTNSNLQLTVNKLATQLDPIINNTVIKCSGGLTSCSSTPSNKEVPAPSYAANGIAQQSAKTVKYYATFQSLIGEIMNTLESQEAARDASEGINLATMSMPGTGMSCGPDGVGQGKCQCYSQAIKISSGTGFDQNGCPINSSAPNANKIAEIPYGNSWWYASDIYLNLNQKMADNIVSLAKAVANFKIDVNDLQFGKLSGVSCSNNTTSDTSSNSNASSGSGTCLSPSVNVTMANVTYRPDTDKAPAAFDSATAISTDKITFPVTISGINTQNLDMMFKSWADLICPYSPSLPIVNGQVQTCAQAQKREDSQNVTVEQSTQAKSGVHKTGMSPAFYKLLQSVPVQFQSAFAPLLYLTEQAPKKLYPKESNGGQEITQAQAYANTQAIITNIVAVLAINHVWPGSETAPSSVNSAAEVSPVQDMVQKTLNSIVGRRLPGNYTPVPSGSKVAENAVGDVGQIFYAIYSLGNQKINSLGATINASFNNIANAQRIGLEMISVVINAIQGTTQFIHTTAKGFIQSDRSDVKKIIRIAEVGGGTTAGISILGGLGVPGASTLAIVSELGTQLHVMVKQIQLQEKIVDQNYDMMMDLMWIPVGVMVATMMFCAGLSFALVVPLIPYILFWAGQIAWLLGVVEAMIAAPLLALAFAHPGGHEAFGHTVPGIRMLIGIFLRPALMVIGMITGLILTFVVIKFSSQGFQIVASEILSFSTQVGNYSTSGATQGGAAPGGLLGPNASITSGVLATLMLFLFCSFIVMAFNKCFSTIYLFPEKVVQFIGGQAEAAGKEDAQQMSQTAGQMGQSASSAGGQSMGQMGQASSGSVSGHGQADTAAAGHAMQAGSAGSKVGGSAGGEAKQARGGSTGSKGAPKADDSIQE